MIVYVAGPMTGLPEFNYPAFNMSAELLRTEGHVALNPARHGFVKGWSWSDYMRKGLADLICAEGVALLPGWENSRGARLEQEVAVALGLDVRPLDEWLAP